MNHPATPGEPDPTDATPPDRPQPSLLGVLVAFGRLGGQAFGGLGPALALVERELVSRRRWLATTDVRDALTYTKPLPGSTVVQVMTFLGWRLAGLPGAVLGTVAFVAPAAVLMAAAAASTAALPDTPTVHGALLGLQVAVVGLLASALGRLLRSEARSPLLAVTAVAAAGAGFVVNAALVVVVAGGLAVVASVLAERVRRG